MAHNNQWPQHDLYLIRWLKTHTGRPIYTKTTSSLDTNLPAYRITRVGGYQPAPLIKTVDYEIDTIAKDRATLWAAVQAAENAMNDLACNGYPEWYVDDVEEIFGPAIDDYENPNLEQATATYRLTVRPWVPRK